MVDWYAVGPRILVILVLLTTNVALVSAMSTSATPYGPYNGDWDGTSELRSTAGSSSVAIDPSSYERVDARETTAFIVAPTQSADSATTARVRQFVTRGGTLVVATETNQTNALLADIGGEARIGERLLRDAQSNYRNPSLPIATNVSVDPLVDGVDSIALNHAGTVEPNGATVLVGTASTAYLDRNRNGSLDPDESVGSRPVATVESVGDGRVVVVSDASVFTNALLGQEDNQVFVERLVGDRRMLLDRSHGEAIPPIPYAIIVIRSTPLIQFLIGLASLGLVGFVAAGGPRRLWSQLQRGGSRASLPATATLSEGDIVAYLSAEHPEWDDQRIQRVAKALNRQRADTDDNG